MPGTDEQFRGRVQNYSNKKEKTRAKLGARQAPTAVKVKKEL